MAVYAMALTASPVGAYKCHHRAIAPWNEAVAMTTRKPGSSEDWTHLGKLGTSRVLVRAEGAIWNALGALGVPAGITKVLKWTVRGAVLAAAALYSLYLFVPLIAVAVVLWALSGSEPSGEESYYSRQSRLAQGDIRSVSDLYEYEANYKDHYKDQ